MNPHIWLLIYDYAYMITHIWLHIYDCTYMIACIWLHIYDFTYMIVHIWLHVYDCTYMSTNLIIYLHKIYHVYDTHIWFQLKDHIRTVWSYVHVYDLHVYDSVHVYDTHIWVFRHMILIYESVSLWDDGQRSSQNPHLKISQQPQHPPRPNHL